MLLVVRGWQRRGIRMRGIEPEHFVTGAFSVQLQRAYRRRRVVKSVLALSVLFVGELANACNCGMQIPALCTTQKRTTTLDGVFGFGVMLERTQRVSANAERCNWRQIRGW